MNRMHHLKQTLPVNIAENQDDPNLEFVVLNYNSGDDMDQWMRTHMDRHIASGLVKYYRTNEPKSFSLAHSKNMATKLAEGDIICNMDADNFAGPGYVRWVRERFAEAGLDILITTIRKDSIPYRDQGGKLCFTKDLFTSLKGYDESLLGYGMDDVELSYRMENAGAKRVFIEKDEYLRFIPHSDQERVANHLYPNNLKHIYQYIPEATNLWQRILYLFIDNSVAELIYHYQDSLRSNLVVTFLGWTIDQEEHRKGTFCQTGNQLKLTFADASGVDYTMDETYLYPTDASSGPVWREIKAGDDLHYMCRMGYNECQNRRKLLDNERAGEFINEKGWGQGNVFRNFDTVETFDVS
jgi:hypothetical protein